MSVCLSVCLSLGTRAAPWGRAEAAEVRVRGQRPEGLVSSRVLVGLWVFGGQQGGLAAQPPGRERS